jgi:glycolate oxidase FAD binding subunit
MADISVRSEAEVVDAVCEARERRHTLEIVGAGTKRAFGRPMQCDDILDVSALSGIVSYQPEELLLTALPGTPVTEINELLAANGQRLGFDPGDWGPLLGAPANSGTIGGAISADVCGSAAVRYGRARDQLLGYRAVNGFGEAYKAGGKVVKNVTGFDLPKLMCGAFGTLGVLTEVTLRVFPKPSLSKILAMRAGPRDGFALLRKISASPLEATGLAYADDMAFVRLEGEQQPLEEKTAWLQALAAQDIREEKADQDIFHRIAAGHISRSTMADIWRVALPPSSAVDIFRLGIPTVSDWAGALHWVNATAGLSGKDLYYELAHMEARFTLVRASEATRSKAQVFPAEDPARLALTRAVKVAFDPLGIFNLGRMYEGI